MTPGRLPTAGQRRFYGALFGAVAAIVVALGIWLARDLYRNARDEAIAHLATLSDLKAAEVEHWLSGQRSHLAQSPYGALATTFDRWQRAADHRSAADAELIARRLEQFKAVSPEYANLWLFDTGGELRFSSAGAPRHPSNHYSGETERALTSRQPVLVDFHLDVIGEGKVAPMLELLAPLFVALPDGMRHVGFLLYQIDPEPYLLPMLRQGPVGSSTAESVLFRVEGDEIVYLSRLRHDPAEPLALRRPMSATDLLATLAVRTGARSVQGVDYRGADAVGVAARIPSMGWHLLTKMDKREIFADARRIAQVVTGGAVLLLLVLGWGGWLATRQLRARGEAARLVAEVARLQTVEALRAADARYQAIVDSGSLELCRWTPETTLTFVNPAYAAARGRPAAELVGCRWIDAVPEGERAGMLAGIDALVATRTGRSYEHAVTRPGRGEVWMACTDTPIFDARGVLVEFQTVALDITDRKRAETALRISEQRLTLALEATNEGLWDWDMPSGRAYLAPTYYTMLGYRPGDFPATFDGWTSLLHPDDLAPLMGELAGLVSEGQDRFELEFRLRTRDGRWRWVLGHGMAVARDADGLPTRILGINLDFTERRLAEAALQESEARFRAIYDNIQEAIFIQDIDSGAILSVNRRACELYGMDEAALCAASIEDISAGVSPYSQADAAYWMMVAAAGERQRFEWQARDSAGRLFWVEVTMRRARLGEHDRLLTVVRDISEHRAQEAELRQNLERQLQLNRRLEEAQNQLLQSEKMASIGQLAAGVAHELNNPIGFVHSNLGTLEGYLKDLFEIMAAYEGLEARAGIGDGMERVRAIKAEKDYAYLRADIGQLVAESRDGLTRVRKIVQDLKDFARVGEAEWQWADLHKGIDSTLNIVWNELKYKCKVTRDYGELPDVFCLPSQLNQVFMNLLVNAGHAIETQGEITIRTSRHGDEVWVEIADSGKGIPRENLNRIFEPFFTTKPVGQGTGLGLSLSYSIVLKHRGRIDVQSEVGRGTTFRVVLPIKPDLEMAAASPK